MVRKSNLPKTLLSIFTAAALSGCAAYAEYGEPFYYPDSGYEAEPGPPAGVPPGHAPPPGQCRIWFPDRPPGHQPPPGDCHDLERSVPPGATIIYG